MSNIFNVAERVIEKKIPWPDHNANHERSLQNHLLYDNSCLRCVLEEVMDKAAS